MVQRARDFLQLRRVHLPVNLFCDREHLADRPHALPQRRLVKQPLNRPRIARKPRLHGRESAEPQLFQFLPDHRGRSLARRRLPGLRCVPRGRRPRRKRRMKTKPWIVSHAPP